ncbi:MAG: hypothetical protein KKI08_21540, partial [Armatimonadetes bacterium]|nr:hypothetical protein [Armatimonadota bacterium]
QPVFEGVPLDAPYASGPGREVGFLVIKPPDMTAPPIFSALRIKRLEGDNRAPAKLAPPPGPHYVWHEVEKLLAADGWITADFWKPSGGLFLYPVKAVPAKAHVDLPGDGPWVVWMRLRDETVNQRQFQATINGRLSYVMGGNNTTSWWWWAVDVVNGKSCDVELTNVSAMPMVGWADCLLFTDDLGFVPPSRPTAPKGYTAYDASADADRGRRAAWLWWPMEPPPDTMGRFRHTFDVAQQPAKAALTVAATGPGHAWLNGKEVPGAVGAAGTDVLPLVRKGSNALALEFKQNGRMPGVKATLTLTYADGTTQTVVTDLTWKAATEAPPNWTSPGFNDAAWSRPFARITEKD